MSTIQQEQTPKFCCEHFANLIKGKVIITKEQAFPDKEHFKDPNFFNIHPNFIMWVEDTDPIDKHGYHWFHYCSNCGTQLDTDEVIKKWSEYWKN